MGQLEHLLFLCTIQQCSNAKCSEIDILLEKQVKVGMEQGLFLTLFISKATVCDTQICSHV